VGRAQREGVLCGKTGAGLMEGRAHQLGRVKIARLGMYALRTWHGVVLVSVTFGTDVSAETSQESRTLARDS
jgi:hypothetical protein